MILDNEWVVYGMMFVGGMMTGGKLLPYLKAKMVAALARMVADLTPAPVVVAPPAPVVPPVVGQ